MRRPSGPPLAHEDGLGVARVPELVRAAGGHGDALARAGDDLLAVELEGERAALDLEGLGLVRVDVRGGDEAVRLHGRLDEDVLAVRLGRGLEEAEALAGDRILDRLSLADHGQSVLSVAFDQWIVLAGRRRFIARADDSRSAARAILVPSARRTPCLPVSSFRMTARVRARASSTALRARPRARAA